MKIKNKNKIKYVKYLKSLEQCLAHRQYHISDTRATQ